VSAGYQSDLAYNHDAGFGYIATHGASFLAGELAQSGIRGGTIVELGCGSGISSVIFADAGFAVVGFDISEPLIDMARQRVPAGAFQNESFVSAELPSCVAVTAFGEVLNYGFDSANNAQARRALFGRIFSALAPGGQFVFDMAGPDRVPAGKPYRFWAEGPDWAVLGDAAANDDHTVMSRQITTFTRDGDRYRRASETHRLLLVNPDDVVASLNDTGFAVETMASYGPQLLPTGLTAFRAIKLG